MACYISSRNNRYYAAVESTYGTVAAVTAAQRFSGLWLDAVQEHEQPRRRDKTGTRTNQGVAGELRKKTRFSLKTYLYNRDSGSAAPRYGALIEGALGATPKTVAGGASIAGSNGLSLSFGGAHGLSFGDAITVGQDLRFIAAVQDAQTVVLSAPLTATAQAGDLAGATVTYSPAVQMKGVSLYDYWSPDTALQRLLRGAAVDVMEIKVNADFHEFTFAGQAADLVDNKSFASGMGGLAAFPAEPTLEPLSDGPVPGHLGQAWIGAVPDQMHTLADARIRVKNNIDFRSRDFGGLAPRCIVAGDREVTVDLELYSQDRTMFDDLYRAARDRAAIPLMIQMGETPGAMCAVYVPMLVPAVPELLDGEERLRWRLRGSAALGTEEDEIHVSFG